jgi:ribosomal protein L24E
VAYLTNATNLVDGDHYESSPGFADIGLTIDGALALAADGTAPGPLGGMVAYVEANAAAWTGYGTTAASGASLGKEALLAEVVGDNPRAFGGEDLISALDATVCTAPSAGTGGPCVAAGNYAYSASTYGEALGIMAQLRADDWSGATRPIQYLESLEDADGGWPSLIPPGTGATSDVDSTAMVVMALALDPATTATAAVLRGITWIAGQQEADGGFPGASGDSTNSTALALLALGLDRATHSGGISAALAFLAARQQGDGGFAISSGPGSPSGSDLRSTTQAVSGAVGTSFATLQSSSSSGSSPPPPTSAPAGAAPVGGYRQVASDGGIFTIGDARFFGSMGGTKLNRPVVGLASTPDGNGYWEVASDGGIFTFGDARFFGSKGRAQIRSSVVGMAPSPDGKGYWEVAANGRIFAFGDADAHGSIGGKPLNRPVVGMASTPDGKGYWEVASDGGIFTFGDARFFGSMGGTHLNRPVVGMASTPDGKGYWEVASDGGIFTFGDAGFHGSMGGSHLNQPVVAMAPTGGA